MPAPFPGGQEGAAGLASTMAAICPPQPGLPCQEVSPAANPATVLTSQTQNHELENQCSCSSVWARCLQRGSGSRQRSLHSPPGVPCQQASSGSLTTEHPHAVTWASAAHLLLQPLSPPGHAIGTDPAKPVSLATGYIPCPQLCKHGETRGKHFHQMEPKTECPSRPSAHLPRPEAVEPSVSRNCRSLTMAGGWK